MEIDKAITGCDDQRLQTKYNNATYVIQRALSLYSIEEVAFSFNGGKDSTVLLHLLRAGYFLHKRGQINANGDLKDFPIRTIYFESPCTFSEINSFTYDTAATYDLQIDTIRLDFKSGLEAFLKENPIRAIFLGVRIGDPTAVGQEQFSPSSPGWPPFMRVNPILDWSYRDVWAFLLTCKVKYCSLYDQGYTSIGSIYDTVPNSLLSISNSSNTFKPAYLLADGRLERAGRVKKLSVTSGKPHADNNGLTSLDLHKNSMFTASIIAVGDEILFGTVEDQLGPYLCRKLHSIGWSVLQLSVVHNNVDSVAEEVERQKSTCDMVFIYGGVGPLHSDVTLAGIAKAFGVRLAPDEEFEEYLRHIIGDQCIGDRNEMAQLPEGITELLHHDKLSVPLIMCQNIIILNATNVLELEKQWECLIELTKSSDLLTLLEPYVSKQVTTNLSDVEIAQPLSKLCLEFPDLYIGCYRKTRYGSVIVSFKGKDQARVESAIKALHQKFEPGAFTAMN
ncbi:putative FAD synthetase [Lupinus albus]|uniref:FAD synthase n=1 Tax=Lupinus albus TaxID=3870 RepID=A0A6A4NUA6_LUPAL|nr:putative FAD synthetase [Lupinus albus]